MDVAVRDLAGGRYTVLEVGRFRMGVGDLFHTAPPDELSAALEHHEITTDPVEFRMLPLIADLPDRRVVIDPGGTGDPAPLIAGLAEAGIPPESIDAVVITHGHLDHYGGCIDSHGGPLFTRAQHFIQRAEWEHWLGGGSHDSFQADNFRRYLEPLADSFTLLEGGDGEILPGLEAVMAPGHSPGHMAVKVGGQVLHAGDALLTSVAVDHPEWVPNWERRPGEVLASRLRILRQAAEEDLLLMLCHTPFPGLGRVRATGGAWEWVPEEVFLA